MPAISGGLLSDTPGAGDLFIQSVVRVDGAEGLLDDVVGTGWHLVATGDAGDVDPELAAWFGSTGGRILTVGTSVEDVEGRYGGWFADHGVVAVIERPDFAVYGTATTPGEVDALLARLKRQLERPPAG